MATPTTDVIIVGAGLAGLVAATELADARGRRLPSPLYPGFDTLGTLAHLRQTGYDYSWFVLTQKIINRTYAELAMYVFVAVIWFVPDQRIERQLN